MELKERNIMDNINERNINGYGANKKTPEKNNEKIEQIKN